MVSGKAVKVSTKTVEVVDSLIKKAVGRKEKTEPQNPTPGTRGFPQNLPPRGGEKGSLTPPSTSDSAPPPLPPRPTLRKRDKLILSADVVLSTIEESIKRMLDTGSEEITRVVTHKYVHRPRSWCLADGMKSPRHGEESGQNAALATGTARNVALVYIDMRGIGRKAIIKRAGKEYARSQLSSGNSSRPRLDQIIADHSSQRGSSSSIPTTSTSAPPLPPRNSYGRK